MNTTEITALIQANLPDNTSKSITPAHVRGVADALNTKQPGLSSFAYFDDTNPGNTNVTERAGDTLLGLFNEYTGELESFTKVTTWFDNTPMTTAKTDPAVYRRKGTEYFRLNWSGPLNIKWFGAKGTDDAANATQDTNAITAAVKLPFDLYISEGTYYINKAIIISKENYKITAHQQSVIKTLGTNINTININANGVVIDGVNFVGSGVKKTVDYQAAIVMTAVQNCRIINSTFRNISGGAIYLVFRDTTGCSNNLIQNNIIVNCVNRNPGDSDNDGAAIRLGYSGNGYFHTYNIIDNNYIDNEQGSDFGVALIGHGYENRITNNTIKNCAAYGILLYESCYGDGSVPLVYRNIIDGNTISDIGYFVSPDPDEKKRTKGMGIYLQKAHQTVVTNNTINNALINPGAETLAQGAIAAGGSCGCTISDNVIRNSNRDGIYISLCFNTTITGNSIGDSKRYGIKIQDSSYLTLSGNTIKDSTNSALFAAFYGLAAKSLSYFPALEETNNATTGEGISVMNNTIYRMASAVNPTITIQGNPADTVNGKPENYIKGLIFGGNTIKSTGSILNLSYAKNCTIISNSLKLYAAGTSAMVSNASCDNIRYIDNEIEGVGVTITNGILCTSTNPLFSDNKIQGATSTIKFASDNYEDTRKTMYRFAPPTTGTFVAGDQVINTNPTITGTAPYRQYIKGWTYTSAGWVAGKAYENVPLPKGGKLTVTGGTAAQEHVVAHGLGVIPAAVTFSPATGSMFNAGLYVSAVDGTNITFKQTTASDIDIYWLALP